MLKIISAAVVAASVMVAPAMAATVIKPHTTTMTHSRVLKPSVANANASTNGRIAAAKKHRHHSRRPHHRATTKRLIHRQF